MIEVSSGRASDAEGQFSAGGRFVRLISDHRIRVAAAILLLAGGFNITGILLKPRKPHSLSTRDARLWLFNIKRDIARQAYRGLTCQKPGNASL